MSQKVPCKICKAPIDIPESIEIEEPYCAECFEATFGKAYMENAEKEAKEIDK